LLSPEEGANASGADFNNVIKNQALKYRNRNLLAAVDKHAGAIRILRHLASLANRFAA
jgi:hypothetical protein